VPPRIQSFGICLPDWLRATVQPLPCAATVGNKRRVAELRGRADEYRLRADLRLRVVAAYGFGASGSYPAISRPAAFDLDEGNALERFTFEESCRLEQTAPLLARAQEFLKERRVVFPAESALLRLVGEQKKLAHESICRLTWSFGVGERQRIGGR
jgi:hypothetical protein